MNRMNSVLALALVWLCGCGKEAQDVAPQIRPVRAIQVLESVEFSQRKFPGQAEATRTVELSFRVTGPLIVKDVERGDRVEKGQLLARIRRLPPHAVSEEPRRFAQLPN